MVRILGLLLLLVLFALPGAKAFAQTPDESAEGPKETMTLRADEPAESEAESRERALLLPRESPTVAPERGLRNPGAGPSVDVDPSVVGLPPGEPLPRARREGAFLVNQPGRLLRPDDVSQWIFQPTQAGDEADALPPMLVLPSARLEMMETYMQEQGGDAWFEVSGRVHTYRGLNYLLLTQARPQVAIEDANEADDDSTADGKPSDADEDGATATNDDDDPMLTALLEQRQAAPSRPDDARTGQGSREQAAVVVGSSPGRSGGGGGEPLRDEGSMLVQRKGRLMQARDGGHVLFVLEADDADSPEAPLILQPCRLFESMERIVRQRGDTVVFVVSGQVQRYHGANYLLPTMMRVSPDKGNLGR